MFIKESILFLIKLVELVLNTYLTKKEYVLSIQTYSFKDFIVF